jgi:hypothetical protein
VTRGRWLALSTGWIVLCALGFVLLRGADDPSRRGDRILSNEAGRRAIFLASTKGYRGYEVVHVAYANAGEGAAEKRWVVLLDRVPHTALREAVVVELEATDGSLLRLRRAQAD